MSPTNTEFKSYMAAQIEETKRHKWIESEKVGYDLGDAAIFHWIAHHAADFRSYYSEELQRQRSQDNSRDQQPNN